MEALPDVHDWYAQEGMFTGSNLRLTLRWIEFSSERGVWVTELRSICFTDVDDLDAVPPLRSQRHDKPRFASRLLNWLIGQRAYELDRVKTARELLTQINQPTTVRGEDLNFIDRAANGFVLVTHLSGAYYIRARTVGFCP